MTLTLKLAVHNGELHSLGEVTVDDVALRNPVSRWLPWFDSYDGAVFNRFRIEDGERERQPNLDRDASLNYSC